jgi:hypothetical protein
MITRTTLAMAVVLTFTGVAAAQRPPDPGRYEMQWAEYSTGQVYDLTSGTREVEVAPATPGDCPPTSSVVLRDPEAGAIWCFREDGAIDESSGAAGDVDVFAPNATGGFDGFHMEGRRARALAPLFLAIGRRQAPSPPPPSPPPSTLRVFMTQPRASATVSGTAWIVLWVEGTSGSSNVFTLSADGRQVASQTTPARGPVSLPWSTASVANGTHTLTATVRDAAGNAGTVNITVIVRN